MERVKSKLKTYRIGCCVLLCLTVLAYILISETMFPMMWTLLGILCCLLPVLIAEMEVCSCIKYFIFGAKQSKIIALLRFLCSVVILLLGSLILLALLLELPNASDFPFYFGVSISILGLIKLLDSVWATLYYQCFESEKNTGKVLLIVGKFIFALLVGYIGFMVTFWASLTLAFASL